MLTVLLYLFIPKGLFPTQDTGQLQARIVDRRGRVVRAHGRAAAGGGARDPADPAVENLSSFIGVDAANNTMLHTGRHADRPQAATTAPRPR